jgi:hypothetical protein
MLDLGRDAEMTNHIGKANWKRIGWFPPGFGERCRGIGGMDRSNTNLRGISGDITPESGWR